MIELSILLKATVMLALGLVAARLFIHAQAAVRHLWLAATLATLAVLPVLALSGPAVTIEVPARYAAMSLGAMSSAHVPPPKTDLPLETDLPPKGGSYEENGRRQTSGASPANPGVSWTAVFRLVWAAGAAAVLASLIVSMVRVRRIRRDGVPLPAVQQLARTLAVEARIRRTVDVLEHEHVSAPLTCGLWRPAIVLPCDARDWADADIRRALVHELEHVRRGDWAVQLAARVVYAGYWFHPLAWTTWRSLCLEAERACDDAVVKAEDVADYADQLVLLAKRLSTTHPRAILGMANRSDLSARVKALLDDRQRRGRAGALAAATAGLAAALVLATIAPVRAVAAVPAPVVSPAQAAAAPQAGAQTKAARPPEQVFFVKPDPKLKRVGAIDRALFEAAQDGDIESIDKLLQAGANVNAAIDGDGSPLIGAARAGELAAVKHLLDRGADPNMPVDGDGAPLIVAAEEGELAVVTLLLERRANIELVVPGDENALIQASAKGRLEVVKLLLASGANVNARIWVDETYPAGRGEWRTPLSSARRGKHEAVVALLLAAGARE